MKKVVITFISLFLIIPASGQIKLETVVPEDIGKSIKDWPTYLGAVDYGGPEDDISIVPVEAYQDFGWSVYWEPSHSCIVVTAWDVIPPDPTGSDVKVADLYVGADHFDVVMYSAYHIRITTTPGGYLEWGEGWESPWPSPPSQTLVELYVTKSPGGDYWITLSSQPPLDAPALSMAYAAPRQGYEFVGLSGTAADMGYAYGTPIVGTQWTEVWIDVGDYFANVPEQCYIEAIFAKSVPTLADKAAELAMEVIRRDYRIEKGNFCTKGWSNCKLWSVGEFLESPEIQYLDCSGLVYWSFNRAGQATAYSPYSPDSRIVTDGMVKFLNPIAFEGANNQYRYNVDLINREDLLPGDLLFFDTDKNSRMDHVAMYVGGPFVFEYGVSDEFTYNTVEATIWGDSIITVSFFDASDETLTTLQPSTSNIRPLIVDGYGRVKPMPQISKNEANGMGIILKCPATLVVTDPQGSMVTKDTREAPDLVYLEFDMDGDNDLDEMVLVLKRETGDYSIIVVPEPGALPTDTYSLEIIANGNTIILAHNVEIENIPAQPYIIRSTGDEVLPIIPATVDFDPDTLNPRSQSIWVTVYIELPVGHGYETEEIDVASLMLNNHVAAETHPIEIGDYDDDGIPDLMVKFDRQEVAEMLEPGVQMIQLTGQLSDRTHFAGNDTVRVLDSKGDKAAESEFDWIIPEEFIADMEENLQLTDDDSVDIAGEGW